MITRSAYERARRRAGEMVREAGILARPDELDAIEVADLGLSMLDAIGLQIMTLVNTPAIGAKVLVLLPGQVFAEHRHPPLGDYAGKEETFRCQWGELYLYVPGKRRRPGHTPYPRPSGRATLPPPTRSACGRASSTPWRPTPGTGSPPGQRAPWRGASRRRPPTPRINSLIPMWCGAR